MDRITARHCRRSARRARSQHPDRLSGSHAFSVLLHQRVCGLYLHVLGSRTSPIRSVPPGARIHTVVHRSGPSRPAGSGLRFCGGPRERQLGPAAEVGEGDGATGTSASSTRTAPAARRAALTSIARPKAIHERSARRPTEGPLRRIRPSRPPPAARHLPIAWPRWPPPSRGLRRPRRSQTGTPRSRAPQDWIIRRLTERATRPMRPRRLAFCLPHLSLRSSQGSARPI